MSLPREGWQSTRCYRGQPSRADHAEHIVIRIDAFGPCQRNQAGPQRGQFVPPQGAAERQLDELRPRQVGFSGRPVQVFTQILFEAHAQQPSHGESLLYMTLYYRDMNLSISGEDGGAEIFEDALARNGIGHPNGLEELVQRGGEVVFADDLNVRDALPAQLVGHGLGLRRVSRPANDPVHNPLRRRGGDHVHRLYEDHRRLIRRRPRRLLQPTALRRSRRSRPHLQIPLASQPSKRLLPHEQTSLSLRGQSTLLAFKGYEALQVLSQRPHLIKVEAVQEACGILHRSPRRGAPFLASPDHRIPGDQTQHYSLNVGRQRLSTLNGTRPLLQLDIAPLQETG